jgi:hypothetical protein
MTILLLYTSLIRQTKTINVEAPSFVQYSHLYSTYSQTLTCPCSNISMNYDQFLHINYTLHQICSSIFLDQSWIDYLLKSVPLENYLGNFRSSGPSAFQALKGFCEMVNRTISDSLTRFYLQQYVSASIMSEHLFKSETNASVDRFRSSMTNNFLLSLSMIRRTTQANVLLSAMLTNYHISTLNSRLVRIQSQTYGRCFCSTSSTCIDHFEMYLYPNKTSLFLVPGLYIGCYVIEALLQSNLECFYSQECINTLQSYISPFSSKNFTALNSSVSSNYFSNSTINELVNQLMIEEWNVSVVYERYFNVCQPMRCTYTLETRNDVIYIVTTLFVIAGGLITALKLVLPRLMKLIIYYVKKQRTRVMPEVSAIET